MNASNVLLYLSYILELMVWLRAFEVILEKKYEKSILYILFAAGDLFLTFLKQYNILHGTLASILMFGYILAGVIILYKESIIIKISTVAGIFVLSLISDTVVVGIGLLMGISVKELSQSGLENSIASLSSKIIIYIMIRAIFNRKFKKQNFIEYKELAILLCSIIVCETPLVSFIDSFSQSGDKVLFTLMVGQITILCIAIYLSITSSVRRNNELNLKARVREIETELESGKRQESILAVKHDVKNHLNIVKELIDSDQIEEAKKYLNRICKIPESIGEKIIIDNKNLEIILNQKRAAALERNITFILNVSERVRMEDVDLCSLIANILDNAIEGAGENGYIELTIRKDPDSDGTMLDCTNTYKNELRLIKGEYKSTKVENGHGYGIRIIRNLAKKYGGNAKIFADNKMFYVKIYIPGGNL